MKVVSVGLYNPIPVNTGSDSYVCYLLNSISKKNEILHYYCSELKSHKGRFPTNINFQTKYLESNFFQKHSKEKIPKLFQLIRPDLFFDKSYISKIKADIVLCDTITYHIAKYISKKNNSPLILIKHDIEWKKLKSDGSIGFIPMLFYEKYILNKADAITTISTKDYQYTIQQTEKNKVYNIPPILDLDVFNANGPSYDFGKDKFNLLFYGSLDRPMNLFALKFIKYNLIPLMREENLFESIRINVFGSGTPPKDLHLEEDKYITYLGVVEDPGMYIRGADLIIVPLKNPGGTKIRVLETIFCGKPALVTPEAAQGLPNELKKFVYVEKNAAGFLKIIKQFLAGQSIKKFNNKIIEDYVCKSSGIDNIINKLIEKRH